MKQLDKLISKSIDIVRYEDIQHVALGSSYIESQNIVVITIIPTKNEFYQRVAKFS